MEHRTAPDTAPRQRHESDQPGAWLPLVHAAVAASAVPAVSPGNAAPTPADAYPVSAAGWGPEVGNGRFLSRWAEDWTGMRAAGHQPPLKAMPLGGEASLTLSAKARVRYGCFANGQLIRGNDYQQGLFVDARGYLGSTLVGAMVGRQEFVDGL
jgi:hypothetical protein